MEEKFEQCPEGLILICQREKVKNVSDRGN